MNEVNQLTTVTVRTLLAHFRSTLDLARQTGEPVIIALRRRQPAGVLLGYETWQALQAQLPVQADTSAVQAELRSERQATSDLSGKLADAYRQVEELSRDLAAARQRVAELELQLAHPQTAGQRRDAWGVEPPPTLADGAETWANQSWGRSRRAEPPTPSGWMQP
jgi:PHD/YefM family antitoxin component YafN of YafNO toxin-antitoxin module